MDARATVDRIKTFIREKDILRLPEPDRCQVIEMPEFQRGNSLAYMNGAPPLDPDAPSFYAISPPAKDWDPKRTQSLLEEYNRHMLQILTIHEAYPGHYVQLEYSSRAPSYLRRVLQSGVMIEGWAVYTEQMMLDQGYGGGDLALRLNQLKFYLRAVCKTWPMPMPSASWSTARFSPKKKPAQNSSAPNKPPRNSAPTLSAAWPTSAYARKCSARSAINSASAATTKPSSPTARSR